MRLYRVMPNSYPEGWRFLSASNNHDRFFFLHTFRSPVFEFNEEGVINESYSYTLTSTILKVDVMWRHNDVNSQRLKDKLCGLLYNQCIVNTCCYSFFIYPTGRIRVCKIRFVSTGENRGNPCLVCKKVWSVESDTIIAQSKAIILCRQSLCTILWLVQQHRQANWYYPYHRPTCLSAMQDSLMYRIRHSICVSKQNHLHINNWWKLNWFTWFYW